MDPFNRLSWVTTSIALTQDKTQSSVSQSLTSSLLFFCSIALTQTRCRYVDTNHDGVISLDELEVAQTKYVGLVLRMMKWVVSWIADTSTPTILRDCDYNHDGKFTADDFLKSYKTCMPSQAALCIVKMSCDKADAEAAKAEAAVKAPRVWWKIL